MKDELVEIVTTVANEAEAGVIATPLVEAGLVACAHVERIRAIYRWEGRMQSEDEVRVTLKTLVSQASEVEKRLLASHPYDTPMLLRRSVSRVNDAYREWARKQLDREDAR